MESFFQYLPIAALIIGVIGLILGGFYYLKNKASHSKTHTVLAKIESQLSLPNSSAGTILEYSEGLKKRAPKSAGSIVLCEFEDGKFDFAIGFKSVPFFIFVRHFNKRIKRLTSTLDGSEYKFQEIVGDTDFGGVIVYDNQDQPILGSLEPVEFSISKLENKHAPFFISDSSNDRQRCNVSQYSDIDTNVFKIEISKNQYVTTTPVFLNDKKVLGFVTALIPAQYKTVSKDEYGKPIRELIEKAKMVGVSTSDIFYNGQLKLDASIFRLKNAIYSGKYNAKN